MENNELIRVVIVEPDDEPYMAVIENTLETFHRIVGGYIDVVRRYGFFLVVNDEGLRLNLPRNRTIYHSMRGCIFPEWLVGTFVVTIGAPDFRSLTDTELTRALQYFSLPFA